MKSLIQALVVMAIACSPFAEAAECNGTPSDCVEVKLTVDGIERLYQYHLPQGSCGPASLPVVMMLHGGGGSASATRANTGYASSDTNCFIYVFPQGVLLPGGGVWTPGDCIGLPQQSGYTGPKTPPGCGFVVEQNGVNDVHYIGAVLDNLKTRAAFDARRVYAAGWSHGGGMCHRLACELSDRITAIAPIEGTIKVAQCSPSRAVPVMEWASLGDTTSPFSGGSGDASVPYSISVHLSTHQLPPYSTPTTTTVVPSVISATITDTVKQWLGGKDGSVVILHTLSSQLPHDWLFTQPLAFDWQAANWTFFKQYSLPPDTNKRRSVRH